MKLKSDYLSFYGVPLLCLAFFSLGCTSRHFSFELNEFSDEYDPIALEACVTVFKTNGLIPEQYIFLSTYPVVYKGEKMIAYLFEEKKGVYGGMVAVIMTKEYKLVEFAQGCF